MTYKLYVLVLQDGTWRFTPYNFNPINMISTFYLTATDEKTLSVIKKDVNVSQLDVKTWELIAEVKDENVQSVREALDESFKYDMHRLHGSIAEVLGKDLYKTGWYRSQRFGTWNQMFVVYAVMRMEEKGLVKAGKADELKARIRVGGGE